MTFSLLVVASIVFFILLNDQRGRIRRIEDRLDALSRHHPEGQAGEIVSAVAAAPPPPPPAPAPAPAPAKISQPARVSALQVSPRAQVAPAAPPARAETAEDRPTAPRAPSRAFAAGFEALAGGKLPIWIGGLALILAGFFLVRYSVEQGLLGPGARTVLAALLGLALLGGSEAARRIARFASDPRVGQALAGAGIASLYGTLYMASELYGLIGGLTAFLLMAMVTAAALFLSLRHGPPTAIMGLIGGFSAPFLAGSSGDLVPLLVYLGLLIAGLFALALHRGWLWLAIAATGGGVLWTLGILIAGLSGLGVAVGVFIVALALAATQILPRTGKLDPALRLLPMVGGFLQLALLAPLVDFAASGWMLYALLSAASLWLGWRDRQLMPASLAALGLVLILLGGAFLRGSGLAVPAAIGATILFALPGHSLARRGGATDRWWVLLALGGTVGPVLVAFLTKSEALLSDHAWGALFAAAAIACASLSWRARREGRQTGTPDWMLAGGALGAGALGLVAGLLWFEPLWFFAVALAVSVGMAGWARETRDRFLRYASLAFAGLGTLFWGTQLAIHPDVAGSVFGDRPVPALAKILALLAVPAVFVAALGWLHRNEGADQPLRWITIGLVLSVALALVPIDWHPAILAMAFTASVALPESGFLPRLAPHGLLAVLCLFLLVPVAPFVRIVAESLIGFRLHYLHLPTVITAAISIALPATIVGAGLWQARGRLSQPMGKAGWGVVGALALATLYQLAKQPFHIASDAAFLALGFIERAMLTQLLFGVALIILIRGPQPWRRWALLPLGIGIFRIVWFDGLLLNPVIVAQNVGSIPVFNAATLHATLAGLCLWLAASRIDMTRLELPLRLGSLFLALVATVMLVRQAFHGMLIDGTEIFRAEHYSYSAALLVISILWLWRGIVKEAGWLRVAGLALLTLTTFKVFLVDASALEGLLRVVSFLGLGAALIGIGWGYGRFAAKSAKAAPEESIGAV